MTELINKSIEDFYLNDYIVSNDGLSIVKYIGQGGDITIPKEINNKIITSIKELAFNNNQTITSIKFDIGTNINIINNDAFSNCSILTNINIPDSITQIMDDCFNDNPKLININVDSNNTYFSSENGILFNYTKTELIKYPEGKTDSSYIIPDSVIILKSESFYNTILSNITISKNVKNINDSFRECKNLLNINVIKDNIYFSDDTNGILFNKVMTIIIKYPAMKQNNEYLIPTSVSEIGPYAFSNCSNLTNIIIPDTVLMINSRALINCTNITTFNISYNIYEIAFGAFNGCTKLVNINININIEETKTNYYSVPGVYGSSNGVLFYHGERGKEDLYYQRIFKYPDGRTEFEYVIPESVTEIEESAFGNNYLKSIIISKNVKIINTGAFYSCENLINIVFENDINNINFKKNNSQTAFNNFGKRKMFIYNTVWDDSRKKIFFDNTNIQDTIIEFRTLSKSLEYKFYETSTLIILLIVIIFILLLIFDLYKVFFIEKQ